ncbi:Partner of Y14 and mago [Camellia lanceoleosa]|uniref:Partner of Y14 and mago n=1 Tax=Camellia lanceoleosa TaxID=1840588 RepID=A0ACC0IJD4_9ERIC|nr:Partner of Y14 and mago [Camellia lanceoleosa]
MAMASSGNGGGGEDEVKQLEAELSKTLKQGERILAPTRRPDGTLRKPIRIRAGYVPQDEVAIYQSKGALWKKEMQSLQDVPPGYDQVLDSKPKTKSAKRNERKKEKRLQAALDKGKNSDRNETSDEDASQGLESVEPVVSELNDLAISANSAAVAPPSNSTQCSTPSDPVPEIDKKIRALKKKIRLAEAQQQKTVEQDMKPEQLEKMAKLEGWRKELKLLEDRKAELS